MNLTEDIQNALEANVEAALREDIGTGDITAELIAADAATSGTILTRENAVVCGIPWANKVFEQVDPNIKLDWQVEEGGHAEANQIICKFEGPSRGLLTAERTALNFLQSLSGTATICSRYAQSVAHTQVKLLDTRKTIPGLRRAQKYAVTKGGCHNHRIGLFDAFLIKENHIMACGSIEAAVAKARSVNATAKVEVEVESMDELNQALSAGADIIMLDNFSIDATLEAIKITNGKAKLEASGGITDETLIPIAETGVDYISIGALTKDCKAIDLSMRLNQ